MLYQRRHGSSGAPCDPSLSRYRLAQQSRKSRLIRASATDGEHPDARTIKDHAPPEEMSHDLDDLSTHRFRAELRVRMLTGRGLGDSTPLASADIAADRASVTLQFAVTPGHLPRDARLDLLEAVFGLLGDQPSRTVRATIPLGDCDLLAGLTRHLTDVRTRAAGATCLIDART